MFFFRKKRQSIRKRLSQIDDFDQNILFGNGAGGRQQNDVVNEGTVDQEFTVNNTSIKLTTNENLVKVQTLERCFNGKVDKEMGNPAETVEKIDPKRIFDRN